MKNVIFINGKNLQLSDIVSIARGHGNLYPVVEIADDAQELLQERRQALEEYMADGNIVYGVNTGCGSAKATIIPDDKVDAYQAHYIPAHCVGTGEYYDEEVTRAAMILRANSFCRGNSGITLNAVEKILALYNAGIIPAIPSQGSVGSSGDLAPLAHMVAAMMGLKGQKVFYQGETIEALKALEDADIEPLVLASKEAMGLTNGATFILSMCVLAHHDASQLHKYMNVATALSLEAIRGEKNAFDLRIHEARGHEGSIEAAKTILQLTAGSKRMTDAARAICLPAEKPYKSYRKDEKGVQTDEPVPRVQDAYSFRAYPQVVVTLTEALSRMGAALEKEINASTDNPLVFPKDGGGFETKSGGNFHGEFLAHLADNLKSALTSLSNISDRRFYALTVPKDSYGLPADLAGPNNNDLNTGLMILQYSTAALVHEMKILSTPSAVDSIPTSAGQEDYVSMGTVGARHLRRVTDMAWDVIGAEIMAAIQGIALTREDLGSNAGLGDVTGKIYSLFMTHIDDLPIMEDGVMLNTIWNDVVKLMRTMPAY